MLARTSTTREPLNLEEQISSTAPKDIPAWNMSATWITGHADLDAQAVLIAALDAKTAL